MPGPTATRISPPSARRCGRRSRACAIRPARTTAPTFPMSPMSSGPLCPRDSHRRKVALTASVNVYIDNCGLRHSCSEPEACVVRAGAVPYKAVQIAKAGPSRSPGICGALALLRRVSMQWKNQGGGPWGSGPKGPWGSGPQRVGPRPPDLEDLLRRGQDRLQQLLLGGYFSGLGIALLLVGALAIWGLSGFFRVQSEELGVVLRFGKHVRTVQPGLNYHLPYPIET